MTIQQQIPRGWICPVCNAVMAPFTPECSYCKPKGLSHLCLANCMVCGGNHGGLICPNLNVTCLQDREK